MDISSVAAGSGYRYEPQGKDTVQEKEKTGSESEARRLGVVLELSPDAESMAKMQQTIKEIGKNGIPTKTWIINGKSVDRVVFFNGVAMSKEDSGKLQDIIRELDEQGYAKAALGADGSYQAQNEALGDSGAGTYAQLGLKVSQLSYACREMGFSEEEAKKISDAYGRQAEEKIKKTDSMFSDLNKIVEKEKQKLYQMIKEKGSEGAYEKYMQRAQMNKQSSEPVEPEPDDKANEEIYRMFANFDTDSRENFRSSFRKAVSDLQNYFNDESVGKTYIDELIRRFNGFPAGRATDNSLGFEAKV